MIAKRADFLPLAVAMIGDEEKEEVLKCLDSGWVTTGKRAHTFEQRIAEYVGAKHAVALASCTHALHLSLAALGVGPGDEVITTPFTFAATANTVVHTGARPVLVDIEEESYTIDPGKIEEKITPKTRAIVPVHYAGHPARMDEILEIARRRNLFVIEDAAHALGSSYRGRKIGVLSHATCFSFYPTKNMTTVEGGAVSTDDADLAGRIRVLSLHGIDKDAWKRYSAEGSWRYDVSAAGFKCNMTDVEASIGMHQILKLDRFLEIRRTLALLYDGRFQSLEGVRVPPVSPMVRQTDYARHIYPLWIDFRKFGIDRSAFIDQLKEMNIGASVHFIPLHLHSYYQKTFGLRRGDFPICEKVYDGIVSLPLFPAMTAADANYVADVALEILKS
ncbi:MAG: UDP-4-amino-4,6-dideoxy-N-acetyl-beta-L-altrosamine transaminase [Candidatus Lindowbacteria bacterium RIFCSPLOWO2_12_FULL_62_27]|nr:MAG: UDP-4-amino-4,6-dideoxy-N-acetyl-beta-L-altrosamine transaminase [Candidatus Lindowbacteria bacterium RIFCSPLOWO2_02_FULL_62_12]OGH60912.1 MAG: UDP-4-amino-4,6-dideoxy-N-acetyl-beta-L-altrosamine transaminase [Candidatus Lindowbacteria bacterium RIFCSPLOWO2_12_FULL_62_27]